jgi:hypothetical protein
VKHLRLVASLAAVVIAGSAVIAIACSDKDKKTSASAASATTALVDDCCASKGAKSAKSAKSLKGAKGTSIQTASLTSAAAGSCAAKHAAATAAGCAAKATAATMANAGGSCSAHGTMNSTAVNSSNGQVDAVLAGGPGCSAHGSTAKAGKMAMHDCDACAEISMCGGDARDVSASVNIVRIKNGLMYVYTAEAPARVQAVQAEMSRRSDHVAAIMSAGNKAKLCGECKELRGAMASGKLNRELVNIEGGCLLLVTSSDAAVVSKLHAMTSAREKVAKS